MILERTSPCKFCPYRKDVPVKTWAAVEFENLLTQDANPMGKTFACHQDKKQPEALRNPCAGYMLDQRRRRFPSYRLRILLFKPEMADYFRKLSTGGLKLYRSIGAMCRANGVKP